MDNKGGALMQLLARGCEDCDVYLMTGLHSKRFPPPVCYNMAASCTYWFVDREDGRPTISDLQEPPSPERPDPPMPEIAPDPATS